MDKVRIFLFGILALLFVSCNNGSKKAEEKMPYLNPPTIELTQQDTLEIQSLTDAFVSMFRNNDLRSAAEMLFNVVDDEVIPYTEEQKSSFADHLSIFHIYDCRQTSLIIRSELNNEVAVVAQILPDGDIYNNKGVTKFVLNPVRKQGVWYLTVRDMEAEGVERVYK